MGNEGYPWTWSITLPILDGLEPASKGKSTTPGHGILYAQALAMGTAFEEPAL